MLGTYNPHSIEFSACELWLLSAMEGKKNCVRVSSFWYNSHPPKHFGINQTWKDPLDNEMIYDWGIWRFTGLGTLAAAYAGSLAKFCWRKTSILQLLTMLLNTGVHPSIFHGRLDPFHEFKAVAIGSTTSISQLLLGKANSCMWTCLKPVPCTTETCDHRDYKQL